MATRTVISGRSASQNFCASHYGNLTRLPYRLRTTAIGALFGGDSSSAISSGDVVRVGILPSGMRVDDIQTIVSDAFPASCVCSVGFSYVDGVDSTKAPQSANYFGSGLTLSAVGRIRSSSGNAPITLPKDAWLEVTISGASVNQVGVADFLIDGEIVGV
jgi:hypothetical protein